MCLCGYSLLLSESTYLSVPPLFGPNPGVRLAREIRFFFFVLCFPSGSCWCRTPPAVGCAGLLWLAGCCTSQYFRACRSSRAVRVLAPTPKSARACCVFSRAWKRGSLVSELISLENQCELAAPQHAPRQEEFPCTCGNLCCFVLDAGSAGVSVRCCFLTSKLFLQWEKRGKF